MKKSFLYCMIFSLSASTIVMAADMRLTSSNVIRMGVENIEFSNDLYMIDEKMYVPIRELSEKMRIPIMWDEEKGQLELLTDFKEVSVNDKTELKEKGVVADESVAYQIGKIILESYTGETLEYETDERIYFLQVQFQEKSNSWRISQTYKFKNNKGWTSGDAFYTPTVVLNKNTGEVISINTYSQIKE